MSSLGDRLAAARKARPDERVEADPEAGQEWGPDDDSAGRAERHAAGLADESAAARPRARADPPATPVMGKRRADVPSEPLPPPHRSAPDRVPRPRPPDVLGRAAAVAARRGVTSSRRSR